MVADFCKFRFKLDMAVEMARVSLEGEIGSISTASMADSSVKWL